MENLNVLGIAETKRKIREKREMEVEGHLLIYKGVSDNSRIKENVGCVINNKYKRYISNDCCDKKTFYDLGKNRREHINNHSLYNKVEKIFRNHLTI